MIRMLASAVALLLASSGMPASLSAQSVEEMVAQAVLPLPEELRSGATVLVYDADTGARRVLRQGTNHVECQPRDDRGFTLCFPAKGASSRDLTARLEAQGLSGEEIAVRIAEAEADGTVEPMPFGSLIYRLYEENDRIQLLWIVTVPNATAAELGMPTASQRDRSLAGMGTPWMMQEGTPGAHLMIPINGTALSNAGSATSRLDSRTITDPVLQATLPLPEDLREDATVVTYDARTGERRVLREGSNALECYPRNPATGFTRCYHKIHAAERDLLAKLDAEGRSEAEIDAAVREAREAGEIADVPFGSLAYRLYEDDDRLRLLWMVRLPNATAEDLGMPVASQRDSSLEGRGTPWMMRMGTPAAHLMIPINGTELSN